MDFPYTDADFSVEENGEKRQPIYGEEPSVTAYETPHLRDPRLWRAWGRAEAAVVLMSNRYRNAWHGAIVALHDYKGTLRVSWRDHDSRVMFEGVIMGAWEREGEHSGAHHIEGQP